MDDVTWAALAAVLTALGTAYTWWAYRRHGTAAGLRGAALTMLPPAAWLTGTLRMFTRIVDAIVDWATHLVFSPVVWLGVGLAGLSVVLLFLARMLGRREAGDAPARPVGPGGSAQPLPRAAAPRQGSVVDDELADIEAILKRRGIS